MYPEQIRALLNRVDEGMESAREELEHARPIAQAAGLTVHSSVLDVAYNGGNVASSSSPPDVGDTATPSEATAPMDLQQEAVLAMQARHKYNPLRGTLSAIPIVIDNHWRTFQHRSHRTSKSR